MKVNTYVIKNYFILVFKNLINLYSHEKLSAN